MCKVKVQNIPLTFFISRRSLSMSLSCCRSLSVRLNSHDVSYTSVSMVTKSSHKSSSPGISRSFPRRTSDRAQSTWQTERNECAVYKQNTVDIQHLWNFKSTTWHLLILDAVLCCAAVLLNCFVSLHLVTIQLTESKIPLQQANKEAVYSNASHHWKTVAGVTELGHE